MSTLNIFELATRGALRFQTEAKGAVTVEDLWNLPLQGKPGTANLHDIISGLHRELKASNEATQFFSTVPTTTVTKASAELQLKFDIVKYIGETRLAEREAATAATAREAIRQKLAGIIERKKEGAMENMSVEELEKMLASV